MLLPALFSAMLLPFLWAEGVELRPLFNARWLGVGWPVLWVGGGAIWLRSDHFFYLLDP